VCVCVCIKTLGGMSEKEARRPLNYEGTIKLTEYYGKIQEFKRITKATV